MSSNKYTVLALLCGAMQFACNQPEESESQVIQTLPVYNCHLDTAILVDVVWQPPLGFGFSSIQFVSNHDYEESGNIEGTWDFTNDCDSIYIVRSSSSFFYRVIYLNEDTLKLRNPVFGDIIYTN